MKNFKAFAILGLLSVATVFTSCEKETFPEPDKDNGKLPRKEIKTGIDFDLATGEEFIAHAWQITDKTNYDVEASGVADPAYNELQFGGVWDHNKKPNAQGQKWNYESFGADGGDFYEATPAGKYLLHFITKGARDKQTSSWTIIEVKQGQLTKIRYKTKKGDKYYQPWRN
jgi:hypothetical protein